MKNTIKSLLLYFLCLIIVLVCSFGIRYVKYKDGLPILGYHHVVSDEEKEQYYKNNIYVMGLSDFEKQMKYLSNHAYQTLSMDEVYAYYRGELEISEKSVVLTFDDGIQSFNTMVKPIMEKYDLKATCFVIGRKTELDIKTVPGKYSYLKQEDLVNDEHVEYYSHTYNLHHKAGFLKKQMEVESYAFIKKDFESNEGIVSDEYFAFPYGRSSSNAVKVIEERDIKLAFGYGQNRNMLKSDDQYLLPRYLMYDFLPMFAFEWIVK